MPDTWPSNWSTFSQFIIKALLEPCRDPMVENSVQFQSAYSNFYPPYVFYFIISKHTLYLSSKTTLK